MAKNQKIIIFGGSISPSINSNCLYEFDAETNNLANIQYSYEKLEDLKLDSFVMGAYEDDLLIFSGYVAHKTSSEYNCKQFLYSFEK